MFVGEEITQNTQLLATHTKVRSVQATLYM